MIPTPRKINISRLLQISTLLLLSWYAVLGTATTAVAQQGEIKREI